MMVYSHLNSHETGRADYVNTGRPPPYQRVAIHQLFCRFAQTHYEPALMLFTLSALIILLTRDYITTARLAVFLVPMLLWSMRQRA